MSKYFRASRIQQSPGPVNAQSIKCFASERARTNAVTRAKQDKRTEEALFGIAFPKTYADLKSTELLPGLDLSNELAWAATTVRFYERPINKFVEYLLPFERALLKSDYETCDAILSQVNKEFGVSVWLIKNSILVADLKLPGTGGRLLADSLFSGESVSRLVRFIARFTGMLVETSGSPTRFFHQVARLLVDAQRSDKMNPTVPYVDYHLAFFSERKISDFFSILLSESNSSIIDRYLAFRRVIQLVASSNCDNHALRALQKCLPSVLEVISDPVLGYTGAVLGVSQVKPTISPRLVALLDRYTEGRYKEAITSVGQYIDDFPEDFSGYEIAAKAGLKLSRKSASLGLPEFAVSLVEMLQSLIQADAVSRTSQEQLWKQIASYDTTCWAANAFAFLQMELNHFSRPLPRHYLAFAELNSYHFPNPRSLKAFSSIHIQLPSSLRASFLTSSTTYRTYDISTQASSDNELRIQLEKLDIPSERIDLIRARYLLERGLYREALALFERNDKDTAARSHYTAFVGRIRALLGVNEIRSALSLTSEALLKQPTCWAKLPLTEILDKAIASRDGTTDGILSLATILGFYARYIGRKYDPHMVDCCEDFLAAENVSDPCEVPIPSDPYEKERLIFFLAYVCVPTVLDSLPQSSGTSEVQRWRIRVCQRILENDHDAARKEQCELEIKELTKALITKRGLIAVEQSMIHVEVDGLRKMLGVALGDSFNRYSNLVTDSAVERSVVLHQIVRAAESSSLRTFSVSGDDLYDTVRTMVFEIRDAFTSNTEYGLNSALSMGIRHGTLDGQMRRAFEQFRLVTRKDAKTNAYTPNTYWSSRLMFPNRSIQDKFLRLFDNFSQEVDSYISHISDDLIQIKTETNSKQQGFFDFRITSNLLIDLLKRSRKDQTLDAFIDSVFDKMWDITDASLKRSRDFFTNEAAPHLVKRIEKLREDIEKLLGGINHVELESNLANAAIEASDRITRISSWFTRAASAEMAGYDLDGAINLAKAMVENVHKGLSLDIAVNMDRNFQIRPKAVKPLYNIFYNLFDNTRKYGARAPGGVSASVTSEVNGELVSLKCENEVGDHVDIKDVTESIEEVKANAANRALLSRASLSKSGVERKSGFYKIAKILVYELGADYQIDLKCEDGRFSAVISLGHNIISQ